jgi:hypothetical protein
MSKSTKKKRNKQYKGSAAATKPIVLKVSAVKRNPVHQWWIDHERIAKPVLTIAAIALVIIVVIIGIIGLIWR